VQSQRHIIQMISAFYLARIDVVTVFSNRTLEHNCRVRNDAHTARASLQSRNYYYLLIIRVFMFSSCRCDHYLWIHTRVNRNRTTTEDTGRLRHSLEISNSFWSFHVSPKNFSFRSHTKINFLVYGTVYFGLLRRKIERIEFKAKSHRYQ